ncbi:hypothetical protein LUZ60_014059 [Juncus effusus]|nr:hypothetical protein LUZ60_014059 [Juncus effusus]
MRNQILPYLLLTVILLPLLTVTGTQTDALNRLIFDPKTLRRHASVADETVSLSESTISRVNSQIGQKEKDKIVKLPGQPGVNFDQYGGYVTVNEKRGRALYYYFAKAVGNHGSSPLLLWLNGGPGCSSLGYGAMEELGPFRVMSDGKTLYQNPFAWNKVANTLFLESPAGVGFSYSNTTEDYELFGDKKTASDTLIFLVNWLERFPEYKRRDFYLAGESYAGHYVPQLADAILAYNKKAQGETTINLKGIMIGNAVINDATDSAGMYDYLWTHALISDETVNAIHKNCNFSADDGGPNCQSALDGSGSVFKDINIYNIYAHRCMTSGTTSTPKPPSIENFDPCTTGYVDAYLNDPKVQEAMHANVTKLKRRWSSCSNVISNWEDSALTVLPIITELLSAGARVWVYSGDIDGRVPVTSTRYSINQLQLSVKDSWSPWRVNNEVGGYSTTYSGNLTLVSVRGAGHEVPSFQPARALALVQHFVAGISLTSS